MPGLVHWTSKQRTSKVQGELVLPNNTSEPTRARFQTEHEKGETLRSLPWPSSPSTLNHVMMLSLRKTNEETSESLTQVLTAELNEIGPSLTPAQHSTSREGTLETPRRRPRRPDISLCSKEDERASTSGTTVPQLSSSSCARQTADRDVVSGGGVVKSDDRDLAILGSVGCGVPTSVVQTALAREDQVGGPSLTQAQHSTSMGGRNLNCRLDVRDTSGWEARGFSTAIVFSLVTVSSLPTAPSSSSKSKTADLDLAKGGGVNMDDRDRII